MRRLTDIMEPDVDKWPPYNPFTEERFMFNAASSFIAGIYRHGAKNATDVLAAVMVLRDNGEYILSQRGLRWLEENGFSYLVNHADY